MPRQEGLIVITGPTGSGKTGLVFELSRHHPIEVISADSMQVYCYMDIATAKPSPEQLSPLPHHLIDIVRPDQEFHAAMFVKMAHDKITEVMTRGRFRLSLGVPVFTSRPLFMASRSPLPEKSGSGRS